VISCGDKVEIRPLDRVRDKQADEEQKIYYSSVQNILSEDRMEVMMPIENSKLVLLQLDTEYEMFIHGATGIYQCFIRTLERYKSNNVYLLVVELISDLRKNQRREYYRYSCALEMHARSLEDEDGQGARSIIVDISGGGLRFVSEKRYEPETLIYCTYHLSEEGVRTKFEVVCKVLAAKEWEKRPGVFEHRVQYHEIDEHIREQIIRYIFAEERKERKKTRLM